MNSIFKFKYNDKLYIIENENNKLYLCSEKDDNIDHAKMIVKYLTEIDGYKQIALDEDVFVLDNDNELLNQECIKTCIEISDEQLENVRENCSIYDKYNKQKVKEVSTSNSVFSIKYLILNLIITVVIPVAAIIYIELSVPDFLPKMMEFDFEGMIESLTDIVFAMFGIVLSILADLILIPISLCKIFKKKKFRTLVISSIILTIVSMILPQVVLLPISVIIIIVEKIVKKIKK